MKKLAHIFTALGLAALSFSSVAAEPEYLRIIGTDTKFVVKNAKGEEREIKRVMTPCAKNKGWLQPLVPVTEIEMLNAMNDRDAMLVDMREPEDHEQGTIPGSHHIVYTEVSARLNELGCKKTAKGWDCADAKKVFAFCNGPVCPQSPTAIQAMTRDGFPASKIYYYRGGMLDWSALGFPVLKGDF